VRLIGIDTPEVFGGVECGGRRASAQLKQLATGRGVLLRTDPSQDTFDRYDRLLAWGRCGGDFHRPARASSRLASLAACGSVSYGGRAYVLYYRGMGCATARRGVRHVHRRWGHRSSCRR
jgi:hypothetical protein